MRRIERDYAKLCEAEGVKLLEIRCRSGHYQLCFEQGTVHCAGTPSDRRNRLKSYAGKWVTEF
ncbi:hypothetical protein, partial [Rhodosalinus sp. FB01]|uniref:hypothetical protein n=1 Tax=Rhodosalinus sp. FB01 TaxID=3239194 RepID=UPI003523CB3B